MFCFQSEVVIDFEAMLGLLNVRTISCSSPVRRVRQVYLSRCRGDIQIGLFLELQLLGLAVPLANCSSSLFSCPTSSTTHYSTASAT